MATSSLFTGFKNIVNILFKICTPKTFPVDPEYSNVYLPVITTDIEFLTKLWSLENPVRIEIS
jgi:hypothetical protein